MISEENARILEDSGVFPTCPLCLDVMNSNLCVLVACGHVLHEECYSSLKDSSVAARCPYCRTDAHQEAIKIFYGVDKVGVARYLSEAISSGAKGPTQPIPQPDLTARPQEQVDPEPCHTEVDANDVSTVGARDTYDFADEPIHAHTAPNRAPAASRLDNVTAYWKRKAEEAERHVELQQVTIDNVMERSREMDEHIAKISSLEKEKRQLEQRMSALMFTVALQDSVDIDVVVKSAERLATQHNVPFSETPALLREMNAMQQRKIKSLETQIRTMSVDLEASNHSCSRITTLYQAVKGELEAVKKQNLMLLRQSEKSEESGLRIKELSREKEMLLQQMRSVGFDGDGALLGRHRAEGMNAPVLSQQESRALSTLWTERSINPFSRPQSLLHSSASGSIPLVKSEKLTPAATQPSSISGGKRSRKAAHSEIDIPDENSTSTIDDLTCDPPTQPQKPIAKRTTTAPVKKHRTAAVPPPIPGKQMSILAGLAFAAAQSTERRGV